MSYSLQDALSSLQQDSDDEPSSPRLETQQPHSLLPTTAATTTTAAATTASAASAAFASAAPDPAPDTDTAPAPADEEEEGKFPSSPVHTSSSSFLNTNKQQVVRIQILRGTLFEEKIWRYDCVNKPELIKRQHVLKGTWRYNDNNDETTNEHGVDQPFDLIRDLPTAGNIDDEYNNDSFFIPSNGIYHGTFCLSYTHTTPKGKKTMKTTSMIENNVKLEFRKLNTTTTTGTTNTTSSSNNDSYYYRIHGSGSNNIGTFSLSGTAKPVVLSSNTTSNNKYIIELRKTYFGMGNNNTAAANTAVYTAVAAARNELSESFSPLLQSQKQSLIRNANTTTTTTNTNTNTTPQQQQKRAASSIGTSAALISTTMTAATTAASAKTMTKTILPGKVSSSRQQKQQKQQKLPPPLLLSDDISTTPSSSQKQNQQRQNKVPPNTTKQHDHQQQQEKQTSATVATTEIAAIEAATVAGTVDRVNGKGMWHAWTRSFDTPLLALLDLFDNAVDASWTLLPSPTTTTTTHQKSQQQQQQQPPKIRVDIDKIGRNGVVMRNGSKFIPSLKQVLQVYKSNKTSLDDNSIGENGIGVKHACASLSTLSLVFTKSKRTNDSYGNNTFLSMGILMQDLQRDDGIVLPSRDWLLYDDSNNNKGGGMSMEDIKHELEVLCIEKEPHVWGKAVLEYSDDSDDISDGIDKCLRHFDLLRTHRDWKDYENVFAVVLTNLKHAAYTGGENNSDGSSNANSEEKIVNAPKGPAMARRSTTAAAAAKDDGDDDDDDTPCPSKPESASLSTSTYLVIKEGGDDDTDEDEQRSLSLLNDLRNKLPYLYLHLHDLDVAVENKSIESIYWERRLSELSKFEYTISQKYLWSKIDREFYTQKFIDDERSVYHISNPNETIRFFCGFDPYRCQNQHVDGGDDDSGTITSYIPGGSAGVEAGGNNSALKIFLYSRQSGRLIKVQNDPRNELGLVTGSTDFCQGLTIIIDDHNGTLPLNPTKQDTAYGHSKYGQIHAANLKEWTAAIVHFYWNYHYMRLGEKKSAITQAVSKSKNALEEAYRNYSKKKEDDNNSDSDSTAASDNSNIDLTTTLSPLYRGSFISFGHVDFLLTLHRKIPRIRANKSARESVVPNIAYNEVARLNEDAASLILTQSTSKKRKASRSEDNDTNNNGGLLADFSQQPQQYQQYQHHNVTSPLITNNRLPSSQDDTGELERELFQVDQQINGIPQQNKRRRQSPNGTDVNRRLQQYVDRNRQLQGQVQYQARDIKILQDECRKLTGEKEVQKKLVEKITRDRNKWMQYGHSKKAEVARAVELGSKMQERLKVHIQKADNNSRKPAPATSPSQEEVVDLTDSDVENGEELAKLRKQLAIYESRAKFYQKDTEAKKVQIDNLMQEKSRFEDRVRDLEQAQLEGGDMLQF